MKTNKLKNLLKIVTLSFGVSLFMINCEKNSLKDDDIIEDVIASQHDISISSTSFLQPDELLTSLRNVYDIDSHIGVKSSGNTQARLSGDKSGIVIYSDVVKKITLGDYTSYTMLIESIDDDLNTFYNITIEEENGDTSMFVTQYKSVSQAQSSKNTFGKLSAISELQVSTRTINYLEEPIGKEDFGNEGSSGDGGSGGGGSSTYPSDCDGFVNTVVITTSTPCGCGHSWEQLLNGTCVGCSFGFPTWPSLETTTFYECIPSSVGDDPPNNSNPGGGSSSGGGDSGDTDDTSITTPISPDGSDEECILLGDLNGDCMVDAYEACVIDNGKGVCDDYFSIREELPFARLDRYLELIEKIEIDPWALIQDCAEQNGLDTQNYLDLYNLPFPQECSDRLFNMGVEWHHQPITDGNVPLANIDYYGVEITTYPDFNNDGNPDSEAEIYQAFRDNFTDLASGEVDDFQFSCNIPFNSDNTGDINWEFIPLTNQDGIDFISNNPISSILLIEADAAGILPTIATDDGAVIVSDFTTNDWTISTIMTANNGTQPFSGNRQWGWIINQNGNLEFFTRAVDVANISILLNIGANTECQQETYYDIAEATWENLQQEIADWINSPESNGGQATIIPKTAIRVDKEKIEELLTSTETINQINCD